MTAAMPTTGLIHGDVFTEHGTGPGHPECPERVQAVVQALESDGLLAELDVTQPRAATDAEVERIHPAAYHERVRRAAEDGHGWVDSPDANLGLRSEAVARLAAGSALEAVDRVLDGRWQRAFLATRPPGHHAEESLAMGFCFYNHVALAARHAQAAHGLERVAIVDWDVHHGNGTQHLFEADGSVLYASLHQFPHYPGTGLASERGTGDGDGATLNCPLEPRTGDREWLAAFEERVLPALEAFAPELVLVSAGFDAHVRDPLSATEVTEQTYARFTSGLLQATAASAKGRLVSILEGGYDLQGLAKSASVHVASLLSSPQ